MIELAYTFGNHMHWVDMEWLWGYDVLPGSTRDMLKYCRETGAKGNVNFDGIGYEKMAAECPEALLELREAVQAGQIEPVGCSYGQPYGQFQGGESNIRQRIYGTRAVLRLLGVRPRTFWEEEFDWFPQLPQMLVGCGFENASLFFQWTWHTPEMPIEEHPAVWWEGIDGSRLRAATRNRLNLHQWPEDFQILLDELAASAGDHASTPSGWRLKGPANGKENPQECCGDSLQGKPVEALPAPLIQQWLELMPSPDWMCRSDLMVPKLKELLADERFKVNFCTLGEYLQSLPGDELPTRRYQPEETWHGMSLGKNGDRAVRESLEVERQIQSAEALQTVLSCFGRPYANWDVYPVWELEEAWRNLLAAQHHDNHECEGLCGHVAKVQLDTARGLCDHGDLGISELAARIGLKKDELLVFNPSGTDVISRSETPVVVPSFGYAVVRGYTPSEVVRSDVIEERTEPWSVESADWTINGATLQRRFEHVESVVNLETSTLWLRVADQVREIPLPLVRLPYKEDSALISWSLPGHLKGKEKSSGLYLTLGQGERWLLSSCREPHAFGLGLEISATDPKLEAGLNAGAKVVWGDWTKGKTVYADSPYAVDEAKPGRPGRRKYPTGDWMTSEQWFEDVAGGFLSQSFVDVVEPDGSGLMIAHRGSSQWWFEDCGLTTQIGTRDPWDGEMADGSAAIEYVLIPHGPITHAERRDLSVRAAMVPGVKCHEAFGLTYVDGYDTEDSRIPRTGDIPREFSFARCHGKGTRMVALYREHENYSGRDLPSYAGQGMGYPTVLRLVEFNGEPDEVTLDLFGTVARAVKTNLLGEAIEELQAVHGDGRSTLTLSLKPREIVTLYLDIEECRKVPRDLDAKRKVWATVHRQTG